MARGGKREIEIKLRVGGLAPLRKRLRDLGAKAGARIFERNTLYDTPRRDLGRSGRLLRIRAEMPAPRGSRARASQAVRGVLTFKARPSRDARKMHRYKVRQEIELAVAEPGLLAAILQGLGYIPVFRYEKYRTRYLLPGLENLHLDLDETPIGRFLELEGPPRAIHRAARLLGFSPKDFLTATYWDLYVADRRRQGRKPRNLVFHLKKFLRNVQSFLDK